MAFEPTQAEAAITSQLEAMLDEDPCNFPSSSKKGTSEASSNGSPGTSPKSQGAGQKDEPPAAAPPSSMSLDDLLLPPPTFPSLSDLPPIASLTSLTTPPPQGVEGVSPTPLITHLGTSTPASSAAPSPEGGATDSPSSKKSTEEDRPPPSPKPQQKPAPKPATTPKQPTAEAEALSKRQPRGNNNNTSNNNNNNGNRSAPQGKGAQKGGTNQQGKEGNGGKNGNSNNSSSGGAGRVKGNAVMEGLLIPVDPGDYPLHPDSNHPPHGTPAYLHHNNFHNAPGRGPPPSFPDPLAGMGSTRPVRAPGAEHGTPLLFEWDTWYKDGPDAEHENLGMFDTVEGFGDCQVDVDFQRLPEGSVLSIFKSGIEPTSADGMNAPGGTYSYPTTDLELEESWGTLHYAVIGGAIDTCLVNGLSLEHLEGEGDSHLINLWTLQPLPKSILLAFSLVAGAEGSLPKYCPHFPKPPPHSEHINGARAWDYTIVLYPKYTYSSQQMMKRFTQPHVRAVSKIIARKEETRLSRNGNIIRQAQLEANEMEKKRTRSRRGLTRPDHNAERPDKSPVNRVVGREPEEGTRPIAERRGQHVSVFPPPAGAGRTRGSKEEEPPAEDPLEWVPPKEGRRQHYGDGTFGAGSKAGAAQIKGGDLFAGIKFEPGVNPGRMPPHEREQDLEWGEEHYHTPTGPRGGRGGPRGAKVDYGATAMLNSMINLGEEIEGGVGGRGVGGGRGKGRGGRGLSFAEAEAMAHGPRGGGNGRGRGRTGATFETSKNTAPFPSSNTNTNTPTPTPGKGPGSSPHPTLIPVHPTLIPVTNANNHANNGTKHGNHNPSNNGNGSNGSTKAQFAPATPRGPRGPRGGSSSAGSMNANGQRVTPTPAGPGTGSTNKGTTVTLSSGIPPPPAHMAPGVRGPPAKAPRGQAGAAGTAGTAQPAASATTGADVSATGGLTMAQTLAAKDTAMSAFNKGTGGAGAFAGLGGLSGLGAFGAQSLGAGLGGVNPQLLALMNSGAGATPGAAQPLDPTLTAMLAMGGAAGVATPSAIPSWATSFPGIPGATAATVAAGAQAPAPAATATPAAAAAPTPPAFGAQEGAAAAAAAFQMQLQAAMAAAAASQSAGLAGLDTAALTAAAAAATANANALARPAPAPTPPAKPPIAPLGTS